METTNLKCILSNPNVAPHVKESVIAYWENNILDKFYTTFFEHPEYPLTNLLSALLPPLTKEFKRRSFAELPYSYIKAHPLRELIRVFSARKFNPNLTDKIWEWSELNFDRWVSKKITKELSFVHTCEHASLETLKRAKQLHVKSFYEQPSIHHQTFTEIIEEQFLKYPAFNKGSSKLLKDHNSIRRNKRRDEELKIADFIICNSTFTKNSLIKSGIANHKILTVPLGFPIVDFNEKAEKTTEKVIFMYAGNLSMGKGTHILLDAWRGLNLNPKQAELWLVGKNNLPNDFLKGLENRVKFFGNIPREELMNLYHQATVFIHPTLADGFGMVITEAMSKGLPVIATHNCAGPDVITHEKDGILINAADEKAIIASIIWSLDNRLNLIQMGIEAKKRASLYSWSSYRANLVQQVSNSLNT